MVWHHDVFRVMLNSYPEWRNQISNSYQIIMDYFCIACLGSYNSASVMWNFINVMQKINLSQAMKKCVFCHMQQQRHRSACTSTQSDQRLCCSLPRQNDTSCLYIWNFKILAGSWAGQFVFCLIGDSRRHIFSWRGPSRFAATKLTYHSFCCHGNVWIAVKTDISFFLLPL